MTFTATGGAGAATKYVVTSSSYNPVAGTAVTITAQLADQYNNAVATSGIAVTFTKTGAGGTFGAPHPATTNASGVATITFTTATTVGTAYTVTATSTVPSTRTGTSADDHDALDGAPPRGHDCACGRRLTSAFVTCRAQAIGG